MDAPDVLAKSSPKNQYSGSLLSTRFVEVPTLGALIPQNGGARADSVWCGIVRISQAFPMRELLVTLPDYCDN